MTDKEMKKLKRTDLLRLLVEQSRQLEAVRAEAADTEAKLREENRQLRQQLEDRQIQVSEAGSLAEASLSINGVIEAAQKAADQYLQNIKERSANQESELAAQKAAAEQECADMRAAAEQECEAKRTETERLCQNATNTALDKINSYWADLSTRLDSFYASHEGLQKLLADGNAEPQLTDNVMQTVLLGSRYGESQ